MKAFSFGTLATLLFWPITASAQLNVLISGGFSGAYEQAFAGIRTDKRQSTH